MAAFCFTESQWDEISAGLARIGRLKYEGDRRLLEMICGHFVQLRPRLGRAAPTPAKARNAWRRVAAAAHKLNVAIAGLRAAGAAEFTFLDGHQGGAAGWVAQLPLLEHAAEWAAELEMLAARAVSNNADPMRDALVGQLARFWVGSGGRLSHAKDGPLVRFLTAVMIPTLAAANENPMTVEAIRGTVRRMASSARE
jgi:DUF971 family protein